MKIGLGEGFILVFISIVFDLIDAILLFLVVGIILNTLIDIIFGLIFFIWFKLKSKISGDEDQAEKATQEMERQKNQLKERYQRLKAETQKHQQLKKEMLQERGMGREIGPGTGEKLTGKEVEKTVAQGVEREATQTAERLAARTGENIAIKEVEQLSKRVGSEEATRLLGRILGRTFLAKLVPFINALPLWTISTVLLLRRNKQDQSRLAEEEQDKIIAMEAENDQYRRAIRSMEMDLNHV